MNRSHSGNAQVAITFVMLSSLLLAGCTSSPSSTDTPATTPTPTTTARSGQGTTIDSSKTEYQTPRGETDSITVHLTVDQDVITDYAIDYQSADPMSTRFQGQFKQGIGQQLIGKSLKGLKVGVVNGASLTSAAFNTALSELQKS